MIQHINKVRTSRYFKSLSSGEIFTESQLGAFKSIMGATPDDLVTKRLIEEVIPTPNVTDILNANNKNGRGNITPAIRRYREINNVNGKEAVEAVKSMVVGMRIDAANARQSSIETADISESED